jgi:dTDP-4-dehydrorhamnose 3,5-epimerase|tara:strand:- start:165 stop:698 length:534 start_codon:yes stop_codon:yes gene_type:complete
MIFTKAKLEDVKIIEIEKHEDERGFFARQWDSELFKKEKLNSKIRQCNISSTIKKGTIRGMHYQKKPFEEVKLVRCTNGKIYDIVIDLRKNSKTYKQWEGFELSENNFKTLYIPEGFAHGFQALEDYSVIFYQVSQEYSPKHETGIRWNDPVFNISWPLSPPILSEKDQMWELFSEK